MDTFDQIIDQHLRALVGMLGAVSVADSTGAMTALPDDDISGVLSHTTAAIRELEALRVVAAGVVTRRSTRDHGHGGLAQKLGHRSAVSLVQQLTGISRGQASTATQLGLSLLDCSVPDNAVPDNAGSGLGDDETDSATTEGGPICTPICTQPPRPWHAGLGEAFTMGRISLQQQTAIRGGLGEPPAWRDDGKAGVGGERGEAAARLDHAGDDGLDSANDERDGADDTGRAAAAAWAAAAEQLIDEASRRTVEDLAAAARIIRDHLDPEGAKRRFDERFQRRSFRLWTDGDGIRHGSIVFEDSGAAWVTAIIDAALRSRRGGPRFVDPEEKVAAERLIVDPRSNEQLTYDLIVDTLHTGAMADAAQVFGTRQAGVRVIVTDTAQKATRAGIPAVAVIEDTKTTVPAAFAAQRACDVGTRPGVIDEAGNPLELGREARLFSSRQKVALGIRDGGCCWPGCDRPASYCEAHHIDAYSRGGRTDVDRGILLCRFHHMNLHHHGWWITRDGTGPFVLRSPDPSAAPIVLERRLERRYTFGDLQPPPTRFRPAA